MIGKRAHTKVVCHTGVEAMIELSIVVCRTLAQRRNIEEVRENVEYLASLPRSTCFRIDNIDVEQPTSEGLLWHYRATIIYASKRSESPERVKKEFDKQVLRVRKACEHKRWGRSPWHIEGD